MIKTILKTLSTEAKRLIYYAFEEGTPHIVKLPDNMFIAVNVVESDVVELEILETAGVWSYGRIKDAIRTL